MPFFSIVTAVRNGLDFFKETTHTVLSQSFSDFEWIIIDDGSTEPVVNFLNHINDPRIRLVQNKVSLGQTKSLNYGIELSKTFWIVRVDGDDLLHQNRLKLTHESINKSPTLTPIIISDYAVLLENSHPLTTICYQSPLTPRFFKYLKDRNNLLCHPSVTFYKFSPSKELYQYDESLKNAQDYALWKKIIKDYAGYDSVLHIPQPLTSYRLVKTSLSGAGAKEQKQELVKIRASTPQSSVKTAQYSSSVLNKAEQEGMYAFRILYYAFIGSGHPIPLTIWLRSIFSTIKYRSIFLKSFLFWLSFPIRAQLKPIFFGKIYK